MRFSPTFYAPTPYSAIFVLYTLAPAPIMIGFGSIRCGVGMVLQFGLDSFGRIELAQMSVLI